MENMFKERVDKVKDQIINSQGIYYDLLKQRDDAKSDTLKELLNNELVCYVTLSEKTDIYLKLYSEKIRKELDNSSEFLRSSLDLKKDLEDEKAALDMIRLTKTTYLIMQNSNDLEIDIMVSAIESYKNAIDRNFKDWGQFAKDLGKKIADTVVDAVPGISELKNIIENVQDVAELINEYEDNAADYSEVDKKLLQIEEHILAMKLSISLTEESIMILEEASSEPDVLPQQFS